MPLVQITLARGRTPEQLAALGQAVTAAVEESIGAPARATSASCSPSASRSTGSSAASRWPSCGPSGKR